MYVLHLLLVLRLCAPCFDAFAMVTDEDVLELIPGSTIKACSLDPLPASIMLKCYTTLIPIFKRVINMPTFVNCILSKGS